MQEKILFVDHVFHKKTRSSDFFLDIVREQFEIEIYYLNPDGAADCGVIGSAGDADIIILWQMDFLAPIFLAMGKPVIVIPMFDGSGGMPDLHWAFGTGARFFNFSVTLHERIRLLGGKSMLLRYFPEAVAERELPRFDELRAFFWERRPDHGIHFDFVDRLIGDELDSMHLHRAPDVPMQFKREREKTPYQLTESVWFEKRTDYQERLAAANVFIAPRVAEGIGMALLEAMARGMLVLAHDAPTNNEYISSGINGVLFRKEMHNEAIQIRSDAQRLGRAAWLTVVEGRQNWEKSYSSIREWIASAPSRSPIALDLKQLFLDLWSSYYGSLAAYENFLVRNLGLLVRYAGLPDREVHRLIGGAPDDPSSGVPDDRIDATGLLDLAAPGDRFTASGWSHAEPDWRWAVGKEAELHFSGPELSGHELEVRFAASALPQLGRRVRCNIAFNGAPIAKLSLGSDWQEYSFMVPGDLVKASNRIHLTFDKARSIPNDARELSVCFKWFSFSASRGDPQVRVAAFGLKTRLRELGQGLRKTAMKKQVLRIE